MNNKTVIQKIVLAAVIINDNKILIVQRNNEEDVFPGMWELPSGKREPLESSEKALYREVKEEVGLGIEIICALSVFDYQAEKESEIRDSTQINFLVKPKGHPKIKLSSEHQAFRWIDKKEINNFNLSSATRLVITKAFELVSKFN